jgi:membrane fusion protein, multidrug efflux system
MVAMPREETLRPDAAIATSRPKVSRGALRRTAMLVAGLGALGAIGYYGYDYWQNGRFMVSTDDAYVQADYTTIAPKVAGYITEVLVRDNQTVKTGQILARIDDRDYQTALDQANADVAAAEAAIRNFDAQVSLQGAEITQAQATADTTRASLQFAQQDAERYRSLMKTGAGTTQKAQESQSAQERYSAQLKRDEAAVLAAQRRIDVLQTARAQAVAQLEHSKAVARQAELNLGYTTIKAPMDGVVGARSLRVGQYVTGGTQLMAVVPIQSAYITANYKETQLAHVHPGQTVDITVDGLPDSTLKGHVDSLAPGAGQIFALLPPDNATGNFTKVVQRIPVKITLDDPRDAALLHAGMSVEPDIDTRSAPVTSH